MATSGLRRDHSILVRVVEARQLPVDCQDAYCVLRIDNNVADQIRTRTIWRSRQPMWDEEYEFQLDKKFKDFSVDLFRKGGFTKDALVGSVRIPKLSLELDNRPHEQWFPLRASSGKKGDGTDDNVSAASEVSTSADASESKKHDFRPFSFTAPVFCDVCRTLVWGAKRHALKCEFCGFNCHKECEATCRPTCGTVGALRLRYRYTEEYILPLPIYGRLLEFFMEDKLEVVVAYGQATDEREEAATALVRITDYSSHVVSFLSRLLAVEVQACTDYNTLFRANSLASKALDYYMKHIGMDYLSGVLKPVVDTVINGNRSCEIDPTRLDKGEEVDANLAILDAYINYALDCIFKSAASCPLPMQEIFSNLRADVLKQFPDKTQFQFIGVSSFIFLRFFNAAILGPKLFGLCTEEPTQRAARTFTLLSKTVQQLANLLIFDGKKEPYMMALNPVINANLGRMKDFIIQISTPSTKKVASGDGIKTLKERSAIWNRRKAAAPAPAGNKKMMAVSTANMDIERELAAIHRSFMRARQAMAARNKTENSKEVLRLFEVLDDMQKVYQERTVELEEERERELADQLAEEVSLQDMLRFPPEKAKAAAVLAASVSISSPPAQLSPRSEYTVNQLRFPFGDSKIPAANVLTADEAFQLLDAGRTGSITRPDFDTLLGTAGLLPTAPVVRDAFKANGLPFAATSLTRADVNALLSALLPQLAAIAPGVAPPPPRPNARGTNTPLLKNLPTKSVSVSTGTIDLAEAVRTIAVTLERLGVLAHGAGSILPEKVLLAVANLGGNSMTQAELAALLASASENGAIDLNALTVGFNGVTIPPQSASIK